MKIWSSMCRPEKMFVAMKDLRSRSTYGLSTKKGRYGSPIAVKYDYAKRPSCYLEETATWCETLLASIMFVSLFSKYILVASSSQAEEKRIISPSQFHFRLDGETRVHKITFKLFLFWKSCSIAKIYQWFVLQSWHWCTKYANKMHDGEIIFSDDYASSWRCARFAHLICF